MPCETEFMDDMSRLLAKVRAHAPSARGEALAPDFEYAFRAGIEAARFAESATEAAQLALSATRDKDDDVRGGAAMAAFITYAYGSEEDPCPRAEQE